MPRFKKQYVHFMWSDGLEGKTVFFEDSISYLKERVENNDVFNYKEVIQGNSHNPFKMAYNQSTWRFCYYDPYYGLKVAREQGKVIQRYWKSEQEWEEYIGDDFPDDISFYRIKPDEPEEKPVTNRELARWVAQGNGECKQLNGGTCIWTDLHYWIGEENTPAEYLIRKWEDEEWVIPTREYMGLE